VAHITLNFFTDGTTINSESVGSIDGLTDIESVKPFGERVYLYVHLSFSFQLMVASFLGVTSRFILTTRKISLL
jgi:hypothetical protein